jgi:putative endonuclease
MVWYVYVLRSRRTGRFYLGSSKDPTRRLAQHNRGKTVSTRGRGPWDMVYCEEYSTRAQASGRERRLKQMKSNRRLEELIAGLAS